MYNICSVYVMLPSIIPICSLVHAWLSSNWHWGTMLGLGHMTFDGSAVAGRGAVTWTGTHDGVPPSDDAETHIPVPLMITSSALLSLGQNWPPTPGRILKSIYQQLLLTRALLSLQNVNYTTV